MEKKRFEDRYDVIGFMLIIVFSLIFLKLAYMTTIEGNTYLEEAQNKVYKKIPIEGPRGEIRDRFGRLLAGNRPSFTVQISKDEVGKTRANEVATKLIKVLEENNEKYFDEFPILIQNDNYVFSFDEKIQDWKIKNNVPLEYDARQSFYYIVDELIKNGTINAERDADRVELQKLLNNNGYFPPIFVSKWKFAEQVKKEEWLAKYKIIVGNEQDSEINKITPKDAFEKVKKYYDIPEKLDNSSTRKILVVRDILKSQGYLQYQPIKIALDVKKETVSKIEELAMELPGVSIQVEPIRYYPNDNLSSHILGQIGKISQENEIEKYIKEKGYSISDMVGKTGVERQFESRLHGIKGYKKVQVDAAGRLIKKIDIKNPVPGDTLYLTIDKDLQRVGEESLKNVLATIQRGGSYDSKWGSVKLRDAKRIYNKATSGAFVALDPKTGEVLAMASYPDYNPNMFSTGISPEDMKNLLPENKNDPLAPKPLYNIAAFTSVQPGSTFKMLTGLAGIENGLSPDYTLTDKGFIMLGNRSFGCWIWNEKHGTHGAVDLYRAIAQSCNYYFYCVSVGYDYSRNKPLPVKMKAEEVLKYARMFGLDEKTGIEMEEIPGKVPNPEAKMKNTKKALGLALNRKIKEYFADISYDENKMEFEKRIDEIVSWTQENPGRNAIMKRLKDLNLREDKIIEVTDFIKYNYFNQANWKTGDTFNLAIGQGEHAYTPLQMARYISGIVNGGYKNKVSVIDKIESYDKMDLEKTKKVTEKIPLKKESNLSIIKKGMLDVTEEGTARATFANFPISVAAKTGTAQKSGRIPTPDEEEYLLSHMGSFNVNTSKVLELADKYEKQDKSKYSRETYLRRAIFSLNPTITNEEVNRFKDSYDNFSWFVSFAPYDDPQIVVVSMIFQGGHGGYAAPIARDIIAQYFGLNKGDNGTQALDYLNFNEELQR